MRSNIWVSVSIGLIAIAATSMASAQTSQERAQLLVEQARKAPRDFAGSSPGDQYYRIGIPSQFDRSIALCREAVAIAPQYYEAYICLANAILMASRDNILLLPTKSSIEALDIVNRAIALQPNRLGAYILRFHVVYQGVDSNFQAAAMYRGHAWEMGELLKTANDKSRQTMLLLDMAKNVWRAEKHEGFARPLVPHLTEAYEQLAQRLPGNPDIDLQRAMVEIALNNIDEAKRRLAEVVSAYPRTEAGGMAAYLVKRIQQRCIDLAVHETCFWRLSKP